MSESMDIIQVSLYGMRISWMTSFRPAVQTQIFSVLLIILTFWGALILNKYVHSMIGHPLPGSSHRLLHSTAFNF
jgi:hypothetical protein